MGRVIRPCINCKKETPQLWENCYKTREVCDAWLEWVRTPENMYKEENKDEQRK